MKLGLIGAGRWGKRYIATINDMSHHQLVHVVSKNPETKSLIPKKCRLSLDCMSFFNDKDIDGAILAVPPTMHPSLAILSLQHNIPVLIEKPLALNVDDAKLLHALSLEKKTLAMVGHTHLYSHAYCNLKEIIKPLGRINKIFSCAGNWGPFRENIPMLWDYAPHDIAMCLDIYSGIPEKIYSRKTTDMRIHKNGESIEIDLTFKDKSNAKIQVSNVLKEKKRYFEVRCDKGTVIYDDQALVHKLQYNSSRKTTFDPISLCTEKPLYNLINIFCKNIENNIRYDTSLDLGVSVVEILAHCQSLLNKK